MRGGVPARGHLPDEEVSGLSGPGSGNGFGCGKPEARADTDSQRELAVQPAGEVAPQPWTKMRLMPTSGKIREALAPPKPNELVSAYSSLALVGVRTTGKVHAASGVCSVEVGGSHCSRNAMRQMMASTAPPAAPSRWPDARLGGTHGQGRAAFAGPAANGVPLPRRRSSACRFPCALT